MKKFNLRLIRKQIGKSVLRFPVAALCCSALFVIAILRINGNHLDILGDSFKWTLLLPLGFTLAVALRLFTEDSGWRNWRSYADMLVIPLLVLYYYLLPEETDFSTVATTYYVVFWLVAITGLCVAPYRSLASPALFWRYSIRIVWKFLFSVACAVILLGSVSLALFAIDALFNVSFGDKWYMYLSCFFGILFAPLFFTAGIPVASQLAGEREENYTVLRILGLYILLPVVVLYLLIFYAYELKIIITWQLPEGFVAWMTLYYSAVGLLVYFLLHYLYITKATKISTLFGRYFFYSELPVIVLLFVAVYRRTADYGITENRYFLWVSALWLLGISLYMIFIKGKSFRPVLVSLACVALLSVVGPWNAFNVSQYSQTRRFEKLLAKQEWLKEGVIPNDTQISQAQEDEWQMHDIKRYFEKRGKSLPPGIDSLYRIYQSKYSIDITGALTSNTQVSEPHAWSLTISTEAVPMEIANYDRIFYYSYQQYRENDTALSAKDSALAYTIKERPGHRIEIYRYGALSDTLSFPDIVQQFPGIAWDHITNYFHYNATPEEMSVIIDPKHKIIFMKIEGDYEKQWFDITSADMYILEKK